MSREALVRHLESTGALQLDSVNVLDRAHYTTLWSRFGAYERRMVDEWVYGGGGYEYWGHEASILPLSHLPVGRRRMRRFPPQSWTGKAWWKHFRTSAASKRRVLKRLSQEGPLESSDFEERPGEDRPAAWGAMPLSKEDKRSLKLLWHAGRVAVRGRRHFRCVYDLAERVYPDGPVVTPAEYEDSWLAVGLRGNGVASEAHLTGYITGPALNKAERNRVITRNLKSGRIVEVRVDGLKDRFFARPEDLEGDDPPEPHGTHLVCPFDSLLWQRKRAEQLTGFRYRIEIYVPAPKREFGYYALPILHEGRFVGRLDPKMHRERGVLEIRSIHLETGFKRDGAFERGLGEALGSLAEFEGADGVELPRGWTRIA